MIDVLYVAYNRLEFTKASFRALLDNTSWDAVRRLYVYDDASDDGTWEFLISELPRDGSVVWTTRHDKFGGPVAAMNHYLATVEDADLFAKVDNDFVMPPHWLDVLLGVMNANPQLDIVGTEPGILANVPPEGHPYADDGVVYRYRPCRHIGGKGLIRASAFDGRPMTPSGLRGYFGFTEWQTRNGDVTKGWIDPDLRSFGLDQLPIEPWVSLTTRYVENGWQRRWPIYSREVDGYWRWWV